ncbi:hypothetical protein OQA88_1399 [Cercophora sp. LCS_1]
MKPTLFVTTLLATGALAAPTDTSTDQTTAVSKRQINPNQWSFAPFRANSCLGSGSTYFGTTSSQCINIGFAAQAVTAVSARCTIVAFVVEGCPGGIGTSYTPGTSACKDTSKRADSADTHHDKVPLASRITRPDHQELMGTGSGSLQASGLASAVPNNGNNGNKGKGPQAPKPTHKPNVCNMQVLGSIKSLEAAGTRTADCQSFLQVTVTAAARYVPTIAVRTTTDIATTTAAAACGVTAKPIPDYASGCSEQEGCSSACNLLSVEVPTRTVRPPGVGITETAEAAGCDVKGPAMIPECARSCFDEFLPACGCADTPDIKCQCDNLVGLG